LTGGFGSCGGLLAKGDATFGPHVEGAGTGFAYLRLAGDGFAESGRTTFFAAADPGDSLLQL
jgi:hypothetical protein